MNFLTEFYIIFINNILIKDKYEFIIQEQKILTYLFIFAVGTIYLYNIHIKI